MLALVTLLSMLHVAAISGTAFQSSSSSSSSSLGGFNKTNDLKMDVQVSQALRLPNAVFYRSEAQRRAVARKLTYPSSSPTNPTRMRDSMVGGMGLSLNNHNHISLGHLTNPKKEVGSISAVEFSQKSTPTDNPSKWRVHDEPAALNYPKHSMRVMGQPINPNIVNKLHPDVSSRKIHRLWKMLSGAEDKYWTSEEAPRVLRQRGVSGMMSDAAGSDGVSTSVDSVLLRKANALNMTFRDQTGAQFLLPETQIQLFRNWLIEQATCEMDFIWKNLGALYYPRWIRMGVCLSRLGNSCSWPPGMKCQPSGSRVLRLLNWNCEDSLQSRDSNNPLKRSSRAIGESRYAQSPTINLRNMLKDSNLAARPIHRRTPRGYSNDPMWRYYEVHRRKDRRDIKVMSPAEEEEQKVKRAKKLMHKLSITSSGYHCYWQVQKYLISDRCTCSCA